MRGRRGARSCLFFFSFFLLQKKRRKKKKKKTETGKEKQREYETRLKEFTLEVN